jgi:glycosyltransferase involved in cell wall biosynthesis
MNLLYFTNSFYNSRNANTIQTRSMSDALSVNLKVDYICTIYRNKGWFSIKYAPKKNKDVYIVTLPDMKLSTLIYSLTSFIIGVRVFLKDDVDSVYARNINVACFFSFIFGVKVVIEVHAPLSVFSSFVVRLFSYFRDIKIVSITSSLKDLLKKENNLSNEIIVVPDAHNVNESVIDRLELITEIEFTSKYKENLFHLGYFGSIKSYKGSQLLLNLVKGLKGCDFCIYTKDPDSVVRQKSIKEVAFLNNSEAIERMREFSALLLFLKKTNKFNDISGFTSPLKLFEYLASGVPIIATKSEVLKEVLKDKINCFMVDDSVDSVQEIINHMKSNPSQVYKVVQNALNDSRRYTYNKRAECVINYI